VLEPDERRIVVEVDEDNVLETEVLVVREANEVVGLLAAAASVEEVDDTEVV
jgi:hypothetical protein